jgi:hypothetical protein
MELRSLESLPLGKSAWGESSSAVHGSGGRLPAINTQLGSLTLAKYLSFSVIILPVEVTIQLPQELSVRIK